MKINPKWVKRRGDGAVQGENTRNEYGLDIEEG